jgi:ribonucleoside-diphosphate reductase subunit M1
VAAWQEEVWIRGLGCELTCDCRGCRIKDMYMHFNERSGLMAPLVADDIYEIIMKVRF